MNRTLVIALAVVSSGASVALFFQRSATHTVFAASPAQSSQSSQSNPDRIVLPSNGKPLTPIEAVQLQAMGLQIEVQQLQTQLKTDEATIHSLQSSLQTLQSQFNNHSHKVMNMVPGHVCTGINQFLVTQAGTGRQVQVGLEVVQACSNPKWNGSTPSSWESLNVSTPVQGAQTQ